jgi:hypothetical protein
MNASISPSWGFKRVQENTNFNENASENKPISSPNIVLSNYGRLTATIKE